jgi:hypothetical protein
MADESRSPHPAGSGDEALGLIAGSAVFIVQVCALVPGLLPFVGLLGVVILVLMLPVIAVGLLGAVLVLPVIGIWRLFVRCRARE